MYYWLFVLTVFRDAGRVQHRLRGRHVEREGVSWVSVGAAFPLLLAFTVQFAVTVGKEAYHS
jgi:hypothetical protein